MVMFCPKCSALLVPKEVKGKKVVACSCGYSEKPEGDMSIKESIAKSERKLAVVSNEEETLPVADHEICEKCKNKGAYYWFIQTRSADEPETRFLKCTKCKHTWREYA
ncbi:MAG: transcription factor S [Candidatus Nanoarchaeia archaeon]